MEKLHQHEIESFLFIAVKQTFKTCVAFILRLSALERGALFLTKLVFVTISIASEPRELVNRKYSTTAFKLFKWLRVIEKVKITPQGPPFQCFPSQQEVQINWTFLPYCVILQFLLFPPTCFPRQQEPQQSHHHCLHHYTFMLNVVIV